ncbi:MAG: Rpn family recombination-promoting nuclease/putative transposase, partial [Synergistaceae bacterium]|nr:Rpn family recombination-promoting nuclease/putative transposase [Synergistaceae bacterium]
WLRLIRSEKEEEIEMLATKTPEMEAAVGRLKQLSADERTQMLYEARQLFLMDEQVRRADARAEGRAEGKAEGRAEGKAEVARNMFAMGWDAEKIAQATNLPVSDIQKLISSLTEK